MDGIQHKKTGFIVIIFCAFVFSLLVFFSITNVVEAHSPGCYPNDIYCYCVTDGAVNCAAANDSTCNNLGLMDHVHPDSPECDPVIEPPDEADNPDQDENVCTRCSTLQAKEGCLVEWFSPTGNCSSTGDAEWKEYTCPHSSCTDDPPTTDPCDGVDCGSSTTHRTNFCKDGGGAKTWPGDLNLNVWQTVKTTSPYCSGGTCLTSVSTIEEFHEDCDGYGCEDGKCLPPVVEIKFTADPESGEEPLNVELETVVMGTARGPITYNLWWDCDTDTNSVASAESSCGILPEPSSGSCAINEAGHKCKDVNSETLTVTRKYLSEEAVPGSPFDPGEYETAFHNPKIIVERDVAKGAEPATAVLQIKVTPMDVPSQLPPTDPKNESTPYIAKEVSLVIHRIFTTAVFVSTALLAFMVVVGGAYMLFAGASPAILSTAKSVFKYAVIGYGVVLIGWVIMGALVGML